MGTKDILISSILVVVLGSLLAYLNILDFLWFGKQDVDLAVCILSARDNFNHRSAIRRSWLTDIHAQQNGTVITKFVVGVAGCPIPPQDRLDVYGCERWEPTIPDTDSDLAFFTLEPNNQLGTSQLIHSVYVKVMHDIVLKRLGLAELFPLDKLAANRTVDVVMYDAVTDEEVTSATFTHTQKGIYSSGYQYRPVEELLLPKGYEFTLDLRLSDGMTTKWQNTDENESARVHRVTRDQKILHVNERHHGIVLIKLLDQDGTVMSSSRQQTFLPAVSCMFSVQDLASLKRHLASSSDRNLTWQEQMRAVTSELQREEVRHADMIMVDVIDVYRNLPEKLLQCHEWMHQRYTARYVLKTDDDCFLNIPQIMTSLPLDQNEAMSWWGNFRLSWPVERFGKWRELDYSSSVYPRFACGSGSVLTHDVHAWLVQNKHLKKFQGEDVSMGIWLSGLDVGYIQDDRWRCDMSCQDDMLSLPELTDDMVWWHWNNTKHCKSPCRSC